MSDLKDSFDAALERSKSLPKQGPAVQLVLYGFFKQATAGDVSGKRPGMLDVRGRAKYDAWKACKGMSADEAMVAYIGKIDALS